MARLPKCSSCRYCKEYELICDEYPNGIPEDIVLEYRQCEKYKRTEEKRDDTLPVASGR